MVSFIILLIALVLVSMFFGCIITLDIMTRKEAKEEVNENQKRFDDIRRQTGG